MIISINTAFADTQIAVEIPAKDQKSMPQTKYTTTPSSASSSENTLPALNQILEETNSNIKDTKVFGVVVGTGSFTGVRIGVALVKGFMSVIKNAKAVAVNSLDLMAYTYAKQNNPTTDFYCIQNALSGRFFVAKFNSVGQRISKYSLSTAIPTGFKVGLKSENLSEVDTKITLTPEFLLEFTKLLIRAEQFVSKNELAPVYIRLSQAEEALYAKEIEILPLKDEHLPDVFEISKARFGANGWQFDSFKEEIGKDGHFGFVAVCGGELLGFVCAMRTFGESGEDFNILNIAVKEGQEGKGFGAKLMDAVKAVAIRENISKLWLEVRESNIRAIKFYEFLGFKTDYIRKHYYSNGENAIIMSSQTKTL